MIARNTVSEDPLNSDEAETPRRFFYGWTLLAVFWFILFVNLAFPMTGGSIINTAMAQDLGFSREALGAPFSIYFGMIGLSSPFVAMMIGRIGVRWTLTIGNFCLLLGSVAMATIVSTPLEATICFGGIIGFAVASGGNLTAQTAIPRWFVRRRALAYAIMLSASAGGGAIIAPALGVIVGEDGSGWRTGWWILAGLALVVTLLAATLVREYPRDLGQYPDGKAKPAAIKSDETPAKAVTVTLAQALGRADFWTIIVASAVTTASLSLVLAHGVANAIDAGHQTAEVGYALSIYALSGLAAKAAVGFLGDRYNPAFVWAGLLVPTALGLLTAAYIVEGSGLFLYALLIGIGTGGAIVCQPATIAHRFGASGFAKVAGAVFLLQAVAGMSAPALAGWAYTSESGYSVSFVVCAGFCLACVLLLAVFCRKRMTGLD
ncbi:MFS transporter [Parasphingopyxis marina]|uniref:MFS transporter n=1 Tax=Parasphingopyxis marina TaxID=2761622 RepID=A0A842HZ28_9SPHN|nr:MFS transporter [Parasphingopyxis marina]MBC2777190.1 MFS transporter [Parasphingopyxis marina]